MKVLGWVFVALMSAATLQVHAATVYKWTDEKGVIHFGDKQPIGQKSESVDVRSGTSHSNSDDSGSSPQEQLKNLEANQEKAKEDKATARKEEAAQKQRAKNCEIAKKNLVTMTNNARIKVEENGEQRFLTPQEVDEKRDEFNAIVERDCAEQK
ncbi:DUF4124 domain-containing protein [Marinobacter sp. 1Y8]